jgi:AcrR family transcriptional regulator
MTTNPGLNDPAVDRDFLRIPAATRRRLSPAQRHRHEAAIVGALDLLATRDYESIQMRDVAERADIAIATLYRYFPSKEYLFSVALERWVRTIETELYADPPTGSAQERLRDVLQRGINIVATVPNWFSVTVALASSLDPLAQRHLQDTNETILRLIRTAMPDLLEEDVDPIADVLRAVLHLGWHEVYRGSIDLAQLHGRVNSAIDILFARPRRRR